MFGLALEFHRVAERAEGRRREDDGPLAARDDRQDHAPVAEVYRKLKKDEGVSEKVAVRGCTQLWRHV
jgi:hypothetical protein